MNGSMSYSSLASQWQSLLTSAANSWATTNHVDLSKYSAGRLMHTALLPPAMGPE